MILVRNIRLPLSANQQDAIGHAIRISKIPVGNIKKAEISKISVDARRKMPTLVYTIAIELQDKGAESAYIGSSPYVSLLKPNQFEIKKGSRKLKVRPVVVGLGPAGLFCGLLLALHGYAPIVLERGPAIKERMEQIEKFRSGGEFNPSANIQFGEGGAGTFSDGKLTTRIGDALCSEVIRLLLEHGAPLDIAYRQKPHIGTDRLQDVIVSLRQEIQRFGGQVEFNTCLQDLYIKDDKLVGISTQTGEIPVEVVVLAVGHSARDTFEMLYNKGIEMQCKPFSVGFRAEHLQIEIEKSLYGQAVGHPALPTGEYQLSHHVGERCVYSFCMCPGGQVVASSSEEGGVVTNGMSYHARDGKNANAAVVVSVDGKDFDQNPLKAISFQRQLEKSAFVAGGKNYTAPAESMGSFLKGEGKLKIGKVEPTYCRGVQQANLGELLPVELANTLRAGLTAFERKLKGYTDSQAILTGLETRTSSPVRIPRGQNFQSVQIQGLYPCGEGAGYAGGIMSAAVDGMKVAQAIMEEYAPYTESRAE